MPWSQKVAARRFAIDGQLAAALAAAEAGISVPAGRQSLRASAEVVGTLLRGAPNDCDVYIRLAGSRDNVGSGQVVVVFAVRPHQNPGESFDAEAAGPL